MSNAHVSNAANVLELFHINTNYQRCRELTSVEQLVPALEYDTGEYEKP
jgi:hypothetical protein